MSDPATIDRVIEIIKPYVKNSDRLATAAPETRLLEDLGVNSARLVDIVLAFEDAFDIAIDDEAADRVATLGDAIAVIRERMN